MTGAEVLVCKDEDVLRVTLNRPEKHNALSRRVLERLGAIFTEHADDDTLKAAILTAAGEKSFAAGGDLRDLGTVLTQGDARGMAEQAKAALDAVRAFPVPVMAALNGNAIGGGAELAVACDFRVAAPHARIGFVQGRLNISTAWGGGIDLMRLIGPDRALGLFCRSEVLPPSQALAIGLFDSVADHDKGLEGAVTKFLRPLLRQAPQVRRAFKAVVVAGRRGAGRDELDALETERFVQTWIHPDHWTAADRVLEKSNRGE